MISQSWKSGWIALNYIKYSMNVHIDRIYQLQTFGTQFNAIWGAIKQRRIRIELGAFGHKMFEIDGNIHYQQILKHLHPIWRTSMWISCKLSKFSNLYDKSEKLLILLRIAFGFGRIASNFFEFDVLIYIQSNPIEFDIIRPNSTAI